MSGRTLIGIVAAVAVIGVGAWLGGVFDSDPAYEPKQEPRRGDVVGEAGDNGGRQNPTNTGGVETSRFTKEHEDDPSGEAAAGEPSQGGGFRLTGKVVNDGGEPVPAARVDLMTDNGTMPGVHQLGKLFDSIDSDDKGQFAFEGLETGERMVLRVTHEAYTMGRAYGIDAGKRKTLYQVVTLGSGHGFRGKVTHKDGRPLEGVRVACYDINLQAYEPEDQIERYALTASDGTYEIRGVSNGIKRVMASQAGLATRSRPTLQVPVKGGQGVDFVMEDGLVIEGTVVEKGTSTPVPGARVMCRLANTRRGNRGPPRVESVLAGEDGRYVLIGLQPGACEVWARGETHLQSQRQIVQAGANNVLVELPPAVRLEGHVVDAETGDPVQRYTLLITGNPEIVISARPNRRRINDPQGRFVFAGVQPMKLWLVARSPGYAEEVYGPITVAQGQVVTDLLIKLGRGAIVTGEVTDSAGKGVKGARVTLKRSALDRTKPEHLFIGPIIDAHAQKVIGTTDHQGRYEVSGLREGKWTIQAEHPRFATDREVRLQVSAQGRHEAPPLILAKAGGIRGIVSTEGKPDPKARVTISSLNNQTLKYHVGTGPTGHFEQLGIPPGDYRIQVIQRNGVVDLGGIIGGMGQGGGTPKVYTVLAGQILEVEL